MNKIKVLVKGPALTVSGYGVHARTLLRALRKYEHVFDVYLEPTSWGMTGCLSEDNEERKWIDELIIKTQMYFQQNGQFDIFIHNTVPNEFQRKAPVSIGMTAGIETTKIAPEWINPSNQMDKLVVVSKHAKYAFAHTNYDAQDQFGRSAKAKVFCPVDVVGYPALPVEPKKIELDLKHKFNFLLVSQFSPRKNIENTIKWFIEEFKNKDVGLILKTSTAKNCLLDRNFTEAKLKDLISSSPEHKCSVYLLHGDMTDEEMAGLYTDERVKAIINVAYGEGFGLPLFEATWYGLPVITINWGGQTEFMTMPVKKDSKVKETFMGTQVSYELKPIQPEAHWPGMIVQDSSWAFVKEFDFKAKLREVHKNINLANKNAKLLKEHNLKKFEANKVYEQLVLSIYEYADLVDKVVDVASFVADQNKIAEMKDIVVYD